MAHLILGTSNSSIAVGDAASHRSNLTVYHASDLSVVAPPDSWLVIMMSGGVSRGDERYSTHLRLQVYQTPSLWSHPQGTSGSTSTPENVVYQICQLPPPDRQTARIIGQSCTPVITLQMTSFISPLATTGTPHPRSLAPKR